MAPSPGDLVRRAPYIEAVRTFGCSAAQSASRETAIARDRLKAISARATTVLTQARISEAPISRPGVSQINILQPACEVNAQQAWPLGRGGVHYLVVPSGSPIVGEAKLALRMSEKKDLHIDIAGRW